RLISLQRALRAYSPIGQIARTKERVADLRQRLQAAAVSLVQLNRARLDGAANRLNAIGPQATLARGYAIVTRENGAIVRSVRNVKPGDNVRVRVSDGTFVTKTIDDGR
ncbi:MAG TPA: exodeoxyribonuclease VII large subunit, partial [Thermoflexales bacterium]|nr:exodeoxyribonuclease VII large subunit [Thermoflexales bacterium]